jgi:hypothetical protein
MNIPPVNPENSFQISRTRPKQTRTESQRAEITQQHSVKTEQSDSFLNALRNDPEVRAEMVEYGRRLAADLNYPPPEMFPKLAELIINSTTK